MGMNAPFVYVSSQAERQAQVARVIAAVERRGGVVSPLARQVYARYVSGELTLGQALHELDTHAARLVARAYTAFGWVD